jgi:hypothetical protein
MPCLTSILDMIILSGETVGTQMREQNDKNDNNSLLLVLLLASPVETTNSDNLSCQEVPFGPDPTLHPILTPRFLCLFWRVKGLLDFFWKEKGPNLPLPTLLTHLGLHLNLLVYSQGLLGSIQGLSSPFWALNTILSMGRIYRGLKKASAHQPIDISIKTCRPLWILLRSFQLMQGLLGFWQFCSHFRTFP